MDSGKIIFANIVISNVIKQSYFYLTREAIVEFKPSPVENQNVVKGQTAESTLQEPSWFLPYILGLQISVLYLFIQTLRKRELPNGRIRKLFIGLLITDLLLNLLDVLQFALFSNYGVDLLGTISCRNYEAVSYIMDVLQNLSVQLHLILCGECSKMMPEKLISVSGLALTTSLFTSVVLAPLTFEKPPDLSKISSFTEYRNIVTDLNCIQRLNSLHLLPCLGLGIICLFQGMRKNSNLQVQEKSPDEKGDGETCVLNIKKFTLRSIVCHYTVSMIYGFLTIGIKSNYEPLVTLVNQFDTADNVLRKFGYLQQVANIICLLACLNVQHKNFEDALTDDLDLNFSQEQSDIDEINATLD